MLFAILGQNDISKINESSQPHSQQPYLSQLTRNYQLFNQSLPGFKKSVLSSEALKGFIHLNSTLSMPLPSSITTRLQYQHKSLLDLINSLTDDQVHCKVIEGKWSIFENIVHLQTYQHVFIYRVREIITDSNPSFDRYSADTDPYFPINCAKSTREIMQDLITIRKDMSAEISSLPEEDLNKTGKHPVFGQMTLSVWMHFFLLHEAHHLFTIFRLVAQLKKES